MQFSVLMLCFYIFSIEKSLASTESWDACNDERDGKCEKVLLRLQNNKVSWSHMRVISYFSAINIGKWNFQVFMIIQFVKDASDGKRWQVPSFSSFTFSRLSFSTKLETSNFSMFWRFYQHTIDFYDWVKFTNI